MKNQALRNFLVGLMAIAGGGAFGPVTVPLAQAAPAPASPLVLSPNPLTIAIPGTPQVLFAVGNSESMDGDLSGAIMTGSGTLSGGLASLVDPSNPPSSVPSSSPLYYTIPAGFTPPVNSGSGGTAPYTVASGGTQYDNSASRLNVAKAAIQTIVGAYAQNTQFALETYQPISPGATNVLKTWVYLMSGPGGFTFTNTVTSPPPSGFEYFANPCYQYVTATSTVNSNCSSIASHYATGVLASNRYMLVASSSDDASINDVLYWTGSAGTFLDYGTRNLRSVPNPYPPNFSITDYNSNSVQVSYASVRPSTGIKSTGPTNAGFVPYSDEVLYSQRGFGYDATASSTTGYVAVPMQNAATTPAQMTAVTNAFSPLLAPETNQSSSNEIKALAVQSPLAGLLQRAQSYLAGLTPPANCGKQYVILISDGLPTQDLSGNLWPPLGSAAAAGYGVTASFNADGSLNTTNDQALTDTINTITKLQQAGINTYVIGLGAGVDLGSNPQAAKALQAMAVAGGTIKYFAATSPGDLVNDLSNVLVAIQNGAQASASVAVNSGSLNTNSTVYQATFTNSDSPYQDWTGDLRAYPIQANGTVSSTSSWSAKTQLLAQAAGTGWQTNRRIATWNPASGTAGAGVPFQWASLSTAQQASLQVTGDPTATPTYAQLRLNYLRGDKSKEKANGGPFRNRSGLLGDIVDSNPLFVGQPLGPYLDASYQAFTASFATTPRPSVLYVGANDGMLHAIDPTTGNELFAFVPNAMFANASSANYLAQLTSPFYNSAHQFFVDGTPAANDALFGSDGQWHTELVGGEGAGGNSIYALDVTNPQNLTSDSAVANAVLWEFTDPGMGQSYSQPIIVRTAANPVTDASSGATVAGFAVMFGNGYNSPAEQPVFYAVKPDTGQIIAKINLCTSVTPNPCNASLPNGLSGVVAANSSGVLGFPVDEVYAGDLQGNLWAIDVSDPSPSNWKVRLLFTAIGPAPSSNPQPITTAPVVTLNPNYPTKTGLMVYFGTGQLLQKSDLRNSSPSNPNTQTFYGVWDNGSATTVTRATLQPQIITTVSAATAGMPQAIRTVTNNPVTWTSQRGWYMDLPASGERVISPAVVESGGVVFDTYAPAGSSLACTAGGQSWLMDVGYANGTPFPVPELDAAGTGNLNSTGQQYNGANPVGIALSTAFVPTPTIVRTGGVGGGGGSGTAGGGVGAVKVVDQVAANGKPGVGSVKERGHESSRAGWWQIQ